MQTSSYLGKNQPVRGGTRARRARAGNGGSLRAAWSLVVMALLVGQASTAFAQAKRVTNEPATWRAALAEAAYIPQRDIFPDVDLVNSSWVAKSVW